MEVPFLDLARQYRDIRAEVDAAVAATLERGAYVLGPEVTAFEREFAGYCGAQHAIGVGSGTEALHLAIRACGIRPGDGVITTPNIAAPTVCAIVEAGAVPVFVDIDPDSFTLDPQALRTYLKNQPSPFRARAVIAVHLYGHPADLDAIASVCGEYGVRLIEDAAQAHGSEYAGRRIGTGSDASCWSFYPTKNLGAYGDAGMVVTNDAQVAEWVRMLRNYGEESKCVNRIQGVNSRLDELQAAVLRVKLRHLDEWVRARRRLAERYDERLAGTRLVRPREAKGARHAYHLYVVRSRRRDALLRFLGLRGVGAAIHYPTPVHLQPAYQQLEYTPGAFPSAERACRQVLSLPLYPELTDGELDQVAAAILAFDD
jgi:dTDP-4-amino-4,6-dideoxygalactose transaminase